MYNYPKIISPRIEIFQDIQTFLKKFKHAKIRAIGSHINKKIDEKNILILRKNILNLIE